MTHGQTDRMAFSNSALSHWTHKRSQGVQWVHLHPQGGEKKIFRRNLQGNFVSAPPAHQVHPQAEQEGILVVSGPLLRATTKKVVTF